MKQALFSIFFVLLSTVGIAQSYSFKVIVYNKMNRQPIIGASVKLKSVVSDKEYTQTTDDSGKAVVKVDALTKYKLEVSKENNTNGEGFFSYAYMLGESELKSGKLFVVELEKVRRNESGLLSAMYFDANTSVLSTQNIFALDNLLQMLKHFATLQVEVGVYADCREPVSLVQDRVAAIQKYLQSKGETKRVTVKPYGNVRALNFCDCSNSKVVCTEEKYQENRRAEFKIISF